MLKMNNACETKFRKQKTIFLRIIIILIECREILLRLHGKNLMKISFRPFAQALVSSVSR